ncbi:YjbH domain-containing protein [Oceaniglobus roseus]|uniref:YjbH domain-containing protein n=1 Tax=Oceaniglobus roseus TaxID=1737570 RepID=UPI0012FFFD9D|nr:YjbH domain-containing protein [Kandeliimicrobium roseum]
MTAKADAKDRSPRRGLRRAGYAALVVCVTLPTGVRAQEDVSAFTDRPSLNFYGVTGLIDMPSAQGQPDGQLSVTVSHFGGLTRSTLTFQILPRIEGSFRYSQFSGLNFAGFPDYFDRSFDISLRLLNESRYLPAVKVGLQDFVGTGLLSGEYLVATKTLSPRLKVTAGLGWGRLGSAHSIGSPFGNRPAADIGTGGKPNFGQWFRGPASPFAGIEYRVNDKLSLLAEYSSDAYDIETGNDPRRPSTAMFDRKSPLNFGFNYRINDAVTLGGYYMYGSEVGLNLNISLNPYNPPRRGSQGPAPIPVSARPDRQASPDIWGTAWSQSPKASSNLLATVSAQLEPQGIIVESLAATASSVDVRVRNSGFDAPAQMVGRVMRALTLSMPASVETFRIVPVVSGIPSSAVTLRRSDIEALESAPDASDRLLAVAGITNAGPRPAGSALNDELFPRFSWNLGPYLRQSYFDPSRPFRFEFGAELSAAFEPVPGLIFSGAVQKKVYSSIDDSTRVPGSRLPGVRTDGYYYDKEGDPGIANLQAAYYFRPGENLYGRITAGYLERMFGGVSGEILYKQPGSRFAIGAELNYVKQRDYDLMFGFRDYDVVTGHVSGYYAFDNGFHVQVDVGRYLAGDYGATLILDREFRNGWSVGVFATLTDVPFSDFGEGSFDKGIRLKIPVSWFLGNSDRRTIATTVRPITRDGGAKLNVAGRLYEQVRGYHRNALEDQWGRVWR